MTNKNHWKSMYEKPLEEIPWEIESPPKELKEIIERKQIPQGKALDLGCGTENYSIYLARKRFKVTGIDFSKNALEIAKKKARKARAKIKFILTAVLKAAKLFKEKFDFILDYSLLHHIPLDKTFEHAKSCLYVIQIKTKTQKEEKKALENMEMKCITEQQTKSEKHMLMQD